jgi:hypothetical protein
MPAQLTPTWFTANGFDISEHGGFERLSGPDRWLRWKDGSVFLGDVDEMDPTIDGPAQDRLVAENVTTAEQLQAVIAKHGLTDPAVESHPRPGP